MRASIAIGAVIAVAICLKGKVTFSPRLLREKHPESEFGEA
jgi:hypothetical protein